MHQRKSMAEMGGTLENCIAAHLRQGQEKTHEGGGEPAIH